MRLRLGLFSASWERHVDSVSQCIALAYYLSFIAFALFILDHDDFSEFVIATYNTMGDSAGVCGHTNTLTYWGLVCLFALLSSIFDLR
jgi:hypothetical protein